jgi:predicted phage terminase large subunit-like protein
LAEVEAELCERALADYIPRAWPVLEPTTEYLRNWHIDVIAEHLEAVSRGELLRLIVNIPPRYMKSICVSVMWPTWTWTHRPESRWIFASYSQSLATKHSVDRRTVIQSDWFQERWGDRFTLASDQNVKTEFLNDQRGHMVATSLGGTATGKGGDILVVDDPLDPEQALSDIEREKANRLFDQKLASRLDDKRTGAIVVIMQRLHEDDVTGHLLAKERGWEHLCLPAEFSPSHPFVWPADRRSEPGELLWPDREGDPEIASVKIDLGSYGYAGQYQQLPAPAEGGILKRAWWRYFDPATVSEPDFSRIVPQRLVSSWDTAFKDKQTSDYVVGQLWGGIGANRYLLRSVRGRFDLPETKTQIRQMCQWARAYLPNIPHSVLVENSANGPEIIASMRNEIQGIIPAVVKGDKTQRAHAIAPQLEAGQVYVPGHAAADGQGPDSGRTPSWVQELIDEAAAFPNATHDDQVDAMSQALLRMPREWGGSQNGDKERPESARAISAGIQEKVF